jgi:DNA-binding transcriptional LysR family regulator
MQASTGSTLESKHPGTEQGMSKSINLRRVKCFVVVAEELNFRRAADRLFMSQPPLSRHIRGLEETLGTQLFERDRQGVQLTSAGETFLRKARSLLQESENLMAQMGAGESHASRVLRVGITTSVDPDVFTHIRPLFERDFPDHRIDIKRQISVRNIRDVGRGMLDMALIGTPTETEGLPCKLLFEEPLMVALPSGHRLARKRDVSLLELQVDKLFWFSRKLNPSYYDHCEKGFNRFNFHPERLPEPDEHHLLLGLIAAGQGIALIPNSLRAIQRKGVVYKTLREASYFKIDVAMIWRNAHLPRHVDAFMDLLANHCALRPR